MRELSQVCSQIVLKKACTWHELGDQTFYGSVHKLAREVTTWTQACVRRWARLISHSHHTNDFRQYCHVGNTAQHCRLGSFRDSDFAGDLEDSKSTSERVLCFFGSRTVVPISWMCKKQTSVSHSSTESDIISLHAGLRMDGYLLSTFQTWKSKCCVQQTPLQDRADQSQETCARQETIPSTKPRPKHQLKEANEMLINCQMWITYPPTHVLLKASLDIFEDNETLIKMIIKGRSPTMRHVSRTHRVALDWLFDRINLEPKIQTKYVDTKNQLADMLTKESFTRDEWNHLLRLFNIMSFSVFSCIRFSNFLSDPIGKQSE